MNLQVKARGTVKTGRFTSDQLRQNLRSQSASHSVTPAHTVIQAQHPPSTRGEFFDFASG